MDAPSLEAFKARLDVALGSLVWWLATLLWQGYWNSIFEVLFNPGHSMNGYHRDRFYVMKGAYIVTMLLKCEFRSLLNG